VPQSPSQATLAQGTVLTKRYRIEKLIGSGGYASVYKATDLTFGYERAIKEVSDTDQGVRNCSSTRAIQTFPTDITSSKTWAVCFS
jgi:serine/threonine protein kinase